MSIDRFAAEAAGPLPSPSRRQVGLASRLTGTGHSGAWLVVDDVTIATSDGVLIDSHRQPAAGPQ